MSTYILIAILLLLLLITIILLLRFYNHANRYQRELYVEQVRTTSLANDLQSLTSQYNNLQSRYEEKQKHIAHLESENAVASERIEQQKQQYKEIMEKMRLEFKTMANEALQQNRELFNKHRRAPVGNAEPI